MKTLLSGTLLDNPETLNTVDEHIETLREITAARGLPETMETFELISKELSDLARKDPPWSAKYIHSIYFAHKGFIVTRRMALAIQTLAEIIDGASQSMAGLVTVELLASPEIPSGILLPKSATVLRCKKPGCGIPFIKLHPSQIYHDPSCRREQWKSG